MAERTFSYWEKSPSVEPKFGYPLAKSLPSSVDGLIVGAGFCGLWAAYFASKSELKKPASQRRRILVLERDSFSYGASSRNAGFLTCGNISEMYADLEDGPKEDAFARCLARLRGVQIVREEFGQQMSAVKDVFPCGSLDYDPWCIEHQRFMEDLNQYLIQHGEQPIYSVKLIETTKGLGGQLRLAFFNSADGAAHPVALLRAMHDAIAKMGIVSFAYGVEVLQIKDGNAKVKILSNGRQMDISYKTGLIAINAFIKQLYPPSSVVPGRGQVIVTSRVPISHLPISMGFIELGYNYFRFVDVSEDGKTGRLLLGGGRHLFRKAEETYTLDTTKQVQEYLFGLAKQILGPDVAFTVEFSWGGIMAFEAGTHRTEVEPRVMDSKTCIIAGCGGSGVALMPFAAKQFVEKYWSLEKPVSRL